MELILDFWHWLFPTSVENIVSDISSKVGKLEAHRDRQTVVANKHSEKALRHNLKAANAENDSAHAHRLAKKFKELVS